MSPFDGRRVDVGWNKCLELGGFGAGQGWITLARLLEESDGPLPTVRLRPIFGGLGEALMDAHDHGIAHEDICPKTIMVRLDDFGRVEDVFLRPPRASIPEGCARHRAPEQAVDASNPRSDVYALGAILWAALTGDDVPAEPSDPRTGRADVPEQLAVFVMRMLSFEVGQRPAMREFVAGWHALVEALAQRESRSEQLAAEETTLDGAVQHAVVSQDATTIPIPVLAPKAPDTRPTLWRSRARARSARCRTSEPSAPAIRVTLIDDNPFMRARIERLLEQRQVHISSSTETTGLRTAPRPPHAIFVSAHLSHVDAFSLVEELTDRMPETPVYVVAQRKPGARWDSSRARAIMTRRLGTRELAEIISELSAPSGTEAPSPAESTPPGP